MLVCDACIEQAWDEIGIYVNFPTCDNKIHVPYFPLVTFQYIWRFISLSHLKKLSNLKKRLEHTYTFIQIEIKDEYALLLKDMFIRFKIQSQGIYIKYMIYEKFFYFP